MCLNLVLPFLVVHHFINQPIFTFFWGAQSIFVFPSPAWAKSGPGLEVSFPRWTAMESDASEKSRLRWSWWCLLQLFAALPCIAHLNYHLNYHVVSCTTSVLPSIFCHVSGVCSVRHQYYHCGDGDGDGHDHSMAAHGQSPEVKQVDIQMGTGLVTPKPRAEDQAQKWGRNGISAILMCIITIYS